MYKPNKNQEILKEVKRLKDIVEPYRIQLFDLNKYVNTHFLKKIDEYVSPRKEKKNLKDLHISYNISFVLWDGTSNFAKSGESFYISSIYFDYKINDFYKFIEKIYKEISEVQKVGKIKISLDIHDENYHVFEEHLFNILPLF
jgi:hypothetical protein